MAIQKVWYYGTSFATLQHIMHDGSFPEDTCFVRHMEDAVTHGGSYVCTVEVDLDVPDSEWKTVSKDKIPYSAVQEVRKVVKCTWGVYATRRK